MNLLKILPQPHVSAQKPPRRLKKSHDGKCSTSLAWVPESLPGTEHTSPSPNIPLLKYSSTEPLKLGTYVTLVLFNGMHSHILF